VVVALEPVSEMAADITDDQQWAATSVSFDHLADAARPRQRGDRMSGSLHVRNGSIATDRQCL